MIRVLMLSPHPDDVAWSLGGTVAALRRAGAELHVVTFFGRTCYAPGHATHGELAASRVRALEEHAWATFAGVRLRRFDLSDASLRGYDDETEIGPSPEPELVGRIRAELAELVHALRPEVIVAPLAAGGHVDHAAVRTATVALRPAAGVAWYEDLPYAADRATRYTDHPVVVDIADHWRAKESGVRYFPSQQPDTVLPILRAHAAAVAGERLWVESAGAARAFLAFINGGLRSSVDGDRRFGAAG